MSIEVREVPDQSRYEIVVDGERVGFSEYRDVTGRRIFTHTEIDPAHGGNGYATVLIRGALDDVRARGLHATPLCPFVQRFIRKHADYLDLVDDAHRDLVRPDA